MKKLLVFGVFSLMGFGGILALDEETVGWAKIYSAAQDLKDKKISSYRISRLNDFFKQDLANLYSNFYKADFSKADLKGINLQSANLSRANFSGADLTGAKFMNAHLGEVDLQGAIICGANFKNIKDDVAKIKINKETIFDDKTQANDDFMKLLKSNATSVGVQNPVPAAK